MIAWVFNIEARIARLGGIARSRDLYDHPDDREFVRIAHRYGRIVHVCKGWWATRDIPTVALEARRAGGRLACASAVAFLTGEPVDGSTDILHVAVPRNASRLRSRSPREVVYHWYRGDPGGSVLAVDLETARLQMARCRAVER
jgi:hypothetical protein